jgi:predicted lipoprotein with Yx(FWY)xxD motif
MRIGSMRALVAAVALMALLAACGGGDDDTASGDGSPSAATTPSVAESPAAATGTVQLADSDLGSILVDADGMTLYLFESDTDGASTCTADCAATWPPLIDDAPEAGDGVDEALLGTTTRDDGEVQVTYDGHPLYGFASDAAPGDTEGQGVGDVWFVVDASGKAVTDVARTGPGY